MRLEPLAHAHAADLLDAGRDSELWRYLLSAQPRTLAEARAYIDQANDELPFAIVLKSASRCISSTRYMGIEPQHRGLEIGGTWIGKPWQRSAVNTECKLLLMQHAFETLGALRVQLKTDARNERSQKAILRLGAQYEGRLRKHRVLLDGFVRDTMYYSVIAEEWPSVKALLVALLARHRVS